MTYTNIPPISYIFVGITTAVLSYVTWAEMQESTEEEPEQFEESEPVEEPQQLEEPEQVEQPEPIEEPPRQVEQNVIGGKKRHSKTKRKRTKKNKKKTKHAKLNLK